jgi:hypothetical protein
MGEMLCLTARSYHSDKISCSRLLKQVYSRLIEDLIRAYINYISKLKFLYTFYKAFFASIIEENI